MKMKTQIIPGSRTLLYLLIFMLSSCVSQRNVWMFQDDSSQKGQTDVKHTPKPVYKLKTGDHLYIKVYSVDPKTSKFFQTDFPSLMNSTYVYLNSYVVDEEGYLHFSFIEKMLVKGLTVEDVKKKLQETLDSYFKEATVTVKLVDFQVSVLGEVNSPGTYTIDKDQVDIYHALGLAGGIKTFGNLRKVTLVRQTLDGSEVHNLNLSDKSMLSSEYYYLMPNDVIYIPTRKAKSFVFETVPYGTILSSLAVVLSVIAIF